MPVAVLRCALSKISVYLQGCLCFYLSLHIYKRLIFPDLDRNFKKIFEQIKMPGQALITLVLAEAILMYLLR